MSASKTTITTFFRTLPAVLSFVAFQSCGTYNSKTSEIENDLLNGDFDNAIVNIDKSKFLNKDRNRLLYLMEKGKLEHLKGNYQASNALLEEAYIMINDKIKTNVGQAISGKLTNPMAEPYKGEDFEKVTIHYYMALNYFQLGMPNEALVEAKRINIKLLELNEKYKENKNKYTEDAFSQILQGILYESTGDINNAFIAYRNAEEIYNKDGGRFFGVPMPEQLKLDLLRTSKQLGFIEEHKAYLKKFNIDAPPAQASGEAIVFWENGLGPAKDQVVITASGGSGVFFGTWMDGDIMEEILIPIPPGVDIGNVNAIAIPKYRRRENYYNKAAIVVDGKEQQFELSQDFFPIAKQCLKDRMLRETINLVTRFASKKAGSALLGALAEQALGSDAGELTKLGADVAGAATEKADTRNWQSLPATIGYARVPLKVGDNKFLLRKYGPQGVDTDTLTIPYRRGLQIVNYFDLGRTQLMPAVNVQAQTTTPGTLTGNSSSPTATPSKGSYRPAPAGMNAQSVVGRYIATIGGTEKVKGVKTQYLRATMKSSFNNRQPTTSEVVMKVSGNNGYTNVTSDGKNIMTVLINNEGAYSIKEGGKREKMDKATADAYRTNYRSPYEVCMLPLQNGAKLEGITTFDNEDAYAVSYTEPASGSGAVTTNYYSVKTGFIIGASSVAGADRMVRSTTHFSDHRNVNGILFPFKMTTVSGDSNNKSSSEIIYTEVKFNEGVSDADLK